MCRSLKQQNNMFFLEGESASTNNWNMIQCFDRITREMKNHAQKEFLNKKT